MPIKTKIVAAMSYVGMLCFVPLIFDRKNRFVSFHARQGLVIWLWSILALALSPLPFGRLLFVLSSLGIAVLSGIGLASVLAGQRWRLPVVFELSEKFWPDTSAVGSPRRGAAQPKRGVL
jgi:uncharacterized membrane protein